MREYSTRLVRSASPSESVGAYLPGCLYVLHILLGPRSGAQAVVVLEVIYI